MRFYEYKLHQSPYIISLLEYKWSVCYLTMILLKVYRTKFLKSYHKAALFLRIKTAVLEMPTKIFSKHIKRYFLMVLEKLKRRIICIHFHFKKWRKNFPNQEEII